MFRGSLIASEEALPAIGAATLTSTSAAAALATENAIVDDTTSLKAADQKPLSYGLNLILPPQKYKYPIAVSFILAAKFFEAFAANGIRTILALYLRDDLFFSENFSTVMLHIFNFFGQFCPIFGAILADSYLGNVRTISSFCYIYAFGWVLLILTSIPNIGISLIFLVSVSLLLIAIGNGSIRACITSLGAMQFKIPQQAHELAGYFSLYYFVYYVGIFLSKLLPPLIRAKTSCFGKESGCYAAVFGTLGTSFLASFLIFSLGRFFYKPEKILGDNILVKFCGCIKHALCVKWSRTNCDDEPSYWLHNAIGRYEESFVNDVAKVLKIYKIFIPLTIYFALLAQQDSSWTFQASMMNTTIGGVTIQPDQAKAIGPILLFILIPLWQYILHPLIKHFQSTELRPLHCVTIGGVCSAFAYVCAGILQEYINNSGYMAVNVSFQIPQFLLIMLGELWLSIPGLQFAFTQAPASMKSVVTAAWFSNNAFGNLIVVIITELDIFVSKSTEFLFYAVMMLVATVLFTLLAYDYELQEQRGSFYSNSTERLNRRQPQKTDETTPLINEAFNNNNAGIRSSTDNLTADDGIV